MFQVIIDVVAPIMVKYRDSFKTREAINLGKVWRKSVYYTIEGGFVDIICRWFYKNKTARWVWVRA